MKRSVQVEIAGQTLTIRSDEGPDYVQQLAEFVDGHLQLLSGSGSKRINNAANAQRIALLVAMQIADELFREKDLHQRFRRKVHERLLGLRLALDQHEQRLAASEVAGDSLDEPPTA
ncbi:cell division protein ZapA [Nannocystis punicea]|uniref:Cell division protein ZapA n=1 Tax=Nannocystis punicea TaxID=2995304 RepID=A0ABY7HJL3_9BACT|nr:cell division protein ZapA [Nannocystis poenicansa]WAS99472.1 cell division protein ZapA [Nannocystis poenicansa]